jgi:prepilin-type N-terminal cleavage/methylation domain-containing protein
MLMSGRYIRRRQRGLSLVELMVGITIGLIVVAAASLLVSGQLTESRRLIAEAQVQQDLRVSADIIVRELRRSGGIGLHSNLQPMVWSLGSAADPRPNALSDDLSVLGSGEEVVFNYFPEGPGSLAAALGFRLRSGVLETNIKAGSWQDLTDPATMEVTDFNVTRVADSVSRIPCPKPCPAGDTACWPRVIQSTLLVRITARHRAFPEILRTHESRIRLRNDHFAFFNVISPLIGEVCPP